MNSQLKYVSLLLLLMLCACQQKVELPDFNSKLLEVEHLKGLTKSEGHLLYVDTRENAQFLDGHIEGAIHIWRDELSDSLQMMKPRDEIAKILGSKGISAEDTLLIYDDHGCAEASRLWWVLNCCGFDNTWLINGGYSHWKRNKLPVSNRVIRRTSKEFQFPNDVKAEFYIDQLELESAMSEENLVLLDTRTRAEYDGAVTKKGALRPGHIPGSIWMDYMESVDPHSDKRILSLENLHHLFESHGVSSRDTIVTYCHSGTRSAQTTFILTQLLKYPNVRNYDGSWIEWSRRQVAVNQAPGE